MRTLWWGVLCGVAMLVVTAVVAQEAALPNGVSGGTVSGRLTFAETQLPARFAEVMLVRKPNAEELAELQDFPPRRQQKPAAKEPEKVVSMTGLSGMDGSYTIADVPPGDWFAVAHMRGYVVPLGTPANSREAHDIAKLTANIPVVHVEAGRAATVDLVLHKGGVIAGRVAFQDGSPVGGMTVRREPEGAGHPQIAYAPLAGAWMGDTVSQDQVETDDDGRYRFAGLPPGKYRISVMLHTAGGMRAVAGQGGMVGRPIPYGGTVNLTVYQPATLHPADAHVFEIRGDERIADADIEVDLNGLHTVSGTVLAKEDRHVPSNVFVQLREKGDENDPARRQAQAEPDGSFHIDYVPPGTYALTVMGWDAEDLDHGNGTRRGKVTRNYARLQSTVVVAEHDVAVDDVLLVEDKAKHEEDDGPE